MLWQWQNNPQGKKLCVIYVDGTGSDLYSNSYHKEEDNLE